MLNPAPDPNPVPSPRPHRRAVLTGAAGLTLIPSATTASATTANPGRPRRIVSLNPCLDVILVRLVEAGRIAALSRYSRDTYGSTIADQARSLPFTRGTTEEVLALSPDLVLADRWGGDRTAAALSRVGIRAERFDVPETVAASLEQVLAVAAAVGETARGQALIRSIQTVLAQTSAPHGTTPISALVFMPGGFASGPGTLMDEMLRRAGLTNAATRYGLSGSMPVPLERLIADPPQLLLTGAPFPGSPGWSERIMEHPALDRLSPRMRRFVFPERLLFCGGPVLMQTARTLSAARRSVVEGRA